MARIIVIFVVLLLILGAEEFSWRKKLFPDEVHRKFGHILLGVFVSLWPWVISWGWIEFLGAGAIAFTIFNYFTRAFKYLGANKRGGFGDMFYAVSLLLAPLLTHSKIFFLIAMLNMALSDSVAALAGQFYGGNLRYKILGQGKTVIGTMAFWIMSLLIIGIAGIFSGGEISYTAYIKLVILMPPALAALENVSIRGIDNLLVPVGAVLLLKLIA